MHARTNINISHMLYFQLCLNYKTSKFVELESNVYRVQNGSVFQFGYYLSYIKTRIVNVTV